VVFLNYKDKYKLWLNDSYFDDETKEQLNSIKDDEKEIEDRFYRELDFGTGGLRGVVGAGTNRLNIYTIRKATQGLANYIKKQGEEAVQMGVAIAYDSRNFSPEFAKETALVLNGNGIKSYVFDELRPVALLSFAVRELKCTAGIVITASHNPPEYNGYKVYWSDGGQVPFPRDEQIIKEVNDVTDFKDIKIAKDESLYNVIGKEIDDKYNETIKNQLINPQIIKEVADNLTIVYTPIHGSGNKPIRRILKDVGFTKVNIVKEQELPDGNFPTVKYPNPEDPKAFDLALKLAKKIGADIIVGTDPDADRVGVIVKNSGGDYSVLTGNQVGIIITEYILSQRKENNTLPENGAILSTIVSTNMVKEITKHYGVKYIEVLTGFKYIGEKIKEFEMTNTNEFLFGFEESYGYLAGTHARDKDAIVSTLLICEVAAYYKSKNISMYEGLLQIYEKYGFYKETINSITLKGLSGLEQIQGIMSKLRKEPPVTIGTSSVTAIYDYKQRTKLDLNYNKKTEIKLPVSDVLYFELEDKSWFCVRPSGTEPKIKIYFGAIGVSQANVEVRLEKLVENVMKVVG
jgi:phosphoglucomutase